MSFRHSARLLSRPALYLLLRPPCYRSSPSLLRLAVGSQTRTYAKKAKEKVRERAKGKSSSPQSDEKDHIRESGKGKHTFVSGADVVPGSQRPFDDPTALAEHAKAKERMGATVEHFRKQCAEMETRASGRVTPHILDPVRVNGVRIGEVATVGVRDGSVLLVTAFEESNLKNIEQAIYDAKIPGITPQKFDARTIKVPIPKPTVDARTSLAKTAALQAEDARVHIRRLQQTAVKKGKWDRHSVEIEEFQKLNDQHIAEVDKLLGQVQKAAAPR